MSNQVPALFKPKFTRVRGPNKLSPDDDFLNPKQTSRPYQQGDAVKAINNIFTLADWLEKEGTNV